MTHTFLLLASLWTSFVNPPESEKPWCYWWWINGHVDRETITADLESMKALGFGGVLMFDSRGYWDDDDHVVNPKAEIGWGTDAWYDNVEFSVRECARLGLTFTMNASASGGTLNGFVDGKEYETDVMDRNAVRAHLDRAVGPLLKRVPDLVGKTFTHIYSVSYEGTVRTGGSWKSIKDAFYATMVDWARSHGLKVYSESGGPWCWGAKAAKLDCSQLDMLAHNDFPQGEFWPSAENGLSPKTGHANANGRFFSRAIVLAARREGRPIASLEAFTHMHRHWTVDPAYLKPLADIAYADGANRLVWHTFTCSPKKFGVPGAEYFAGSHINRNVTWQKDAAPFVRYLGRCQALLQRGQPVDDGEFVDVQTNYHGWGRFRKNENAQFTATHRREGKTDFFFVAGEGKGEVVLNAALNGRQVELWDAVSVERHPLSAKAADGDKTAVTLDLPKGGSCFVVFSPTAERLPPKAADAFVQPIASAWDVSFAYHPGIAARPPNPVTMAALRDFTSYGTPDAADSASLRYFSGTATYRTTVELTADAAKCVKALEIGALKTGVAHVYVNGVDCGVAWCAPWRVCVADAVRAGNNEVEIRYANNWHNRLVGDCRLPQAERVTHSTLHYWTVPRTGDVKAPWKQKPTVYSGPSAFDPLQPSGLVGPVRLLGGDAAASGGSAVRIGFGLDGKASLGETGATMATAVYESGWSRTVRAQSANYRMAADNVREVVYRSGDETCLTGTVSLIRRGEAAALTTAFVAVRDFDTECAALTLELPVSAFGGGSWRSSTGREGTLARDWDGKTTAFFSGKVDWLEFRSASGTCFRIAVPGGGLAAVQDDRKWKVDNFTVRFYVPGGKRIAKGEVRRLTCEVSSPSGVVLAPDRKTTVKAGPDWIPLDYKKDIVAGSALDFSNQGLQDAPAGKYGWLRNVGGHFEFERKPGAKQRFYGVNLCFDACFPDRELADRLVTRLVRLGYNTVRIHHYEGVRGLFKGTDLKKGFNADQVVRLDHLLAQCYANGIYVTTDLFTIRRVMWRDIGIDRDGEVPMQIYKNLIALHEPAFANWCAFARQFLTHVNAETGRAHRDEPGLPLISLINEGQLTWCWHKIRNEEPVRRAWTAWLAEKRAADPAFAEGRETDPLRIHAGDDALLVRFMADAERKLVVRQREFLRALGVKALLTNQNCGPHPAPMIAVSEDLYDYVDDHFYVDHPQFPVKPWSLPSRCGNRNPVRSSYCPYLTVAFTRSPRKPFCITEWNFSGPGMFRGSGGILTGALGALQDWDGLWRFAYSHGIEPLCDDQGAPGYFDVASDPLGLASDRASICLFLRGDIAPLADAVANRVVRTDRLPEGGKEPSVAPAWMSAAWQTRVATTLGDVSGWKEVRLADCRTNAVPPVSLAANPAVDFDKERGSFRIMTPKTCGGFAPSGRLSSGAIDFDVGDVAATVWASSLDGRPVAESKRILVTHLTDVQADGNVYANEAKTLLLKWGQRRSVVRNGKADVSLALAEPADYEVWALETTGRRLERIPTRIEAGRLTFTAAVKGPNGARMLYEVAL